MQKGDVIIFDTVDGGEITVIDGVIDMDGGITSCAYLALFGGNESDPSHDDKSKSWWGNSIEDDEYKELRGRFQYLLGKINPTSGNLQKLQRAAEYDLQFFLEEDIASSLSVSIGYPSLNRIDIVINLIADGKNITIKFIENWENTNK